VPSAEPPAPGVGRQVTVGIDIGTTAVKAVAADDDGEVVARVRLPHPVVTPDAGTLEHDAARAWRRGAIAAYDAVRRDLDVRAVDVAAMVPSLCAVDDDGHPITAGVLYGDRRGGVAGPASPAESGELAGLLTWCAAEAPGAAGYWPAQAVANHALCGVGAIDTVTAVTAQPLHRDGAWDPAAVAAAGARPDQLPVVLPDDRPIAVVDGVAYGPGTVDGFAEQLVAGADDPGDVLVILGATLVVWVVTQGWPVVDGLWTVPHSAPGRTLVGGASNAGGLFLDWVDRLLVPDEPDAPSDPAAVPRWSPYLRGERTPLHDPDRRAALVDLDAGHGPAAVRRAAREATGFVVRHVVDRSGLAARRIVVTGGGGHDQRWVGAVADATGLPVDVVAVPEGAALGAAFLARVVAGLERGAEDAGRWARVGHRVEPDPMWAAAADGRYRRFLADAGSVAAAGVPSC
jgi:xylulokinase